MFEGVGAGGGELAQEAWMEPGVIEAGQDDGNADLQTSLLQAERQVPSVLAFPT